MARITYVTHDGAEHVIDAQHGVSLMQNAVDNLIPGIDADCGGECACATCHIVVDESWVASLGTAANGEESLLELHPEREAASRLSCQIEIGPEHDGLHVRVPEFQM